MNYDRDDHTSVHHHRAIMDLTLSLDLISTKIANIYHRLFNARCYQSMWSHGRLQGRYHMSISLDLRQLPVEASSFTTIVATGTSSYLVVPSVESPPPAAGDDAVLECCSTPFLFWLAWDRTESHRVVESLRRWFHEPELRLMMLPRFEFPLLDVPLSFATGPRRRISLLVVHLPWRVATDSPRPETTTKPFLELPCISGFLRITIARYTLLPMTNTTLDTEKIQISNARLMNTAFVEASLPSTAKKGIPI